MQTELLQIQPLQRDQDQDQETGHDLHQLNNHLAIIMANLHMCTQRHDELDEEVEEMLEQARRAAAQAARVVHGMQMRLMGLRCSDVTQI
jgi:CO dehydrogenase/acetyl-CoA synthase beta subunit